MARGVNTVILIGNIGRDPETKYTPGGAPVTHFSVATSETWKDKQSGQKQERTEWHNIVCFNKLAEYAGQYLRKGSKVYVEGSLRTNKWEKDGQNHYRTEIIANRIESLDSRDQSSQPQHQQQQPQQQRQAAPSHNRQESRDNYNQPDNNNSNTRQNLAPDFDDDIPF